MISTSSPILIGLMMLFTGIIVACWLASKKSIIIDVIAGVLGLFVVAWVIVQLHVF